MLSIETKKSFKNLQEVIKHWAKMTIFKPKNRFTWLPEPADFFAHPIALIFLPISSILYIEIRLSKKMERNKLRKARNKQKVKDFKVFSVRNHQLKDDLMLFPIFLMWCSTFKSLLDWGKKCKKNLNGPPLQNEKIVQFSEYPWTTPTGLWYVSL